MDNRKLNSSLPPRVCVEDAFLFGVKKLKSDKEEMLIAKAQSSDKEAFELLLKNYKNMILSIAYYISQNEYDALDMAQEVYVKLYKNIDKFEGKSKFSTWVYSVARNTCIDEYKRIKRNKNYYESDEKNVSVETEGPEEIILKKELCDFVRIMLSELPPIYNKILTLRYINGLSYREIAEKLKCSEGTVKSRLFRGKKIMKKIIDERFKNI